MHAKNNEMSCQAEFKSLTEEIESLGKGKEALEIKKPFNKTQGL